MKKSSICLMGLGFVIVVFLIGKYAFNETDATFLLLFVPVCALCYLYQKGAELKTVLNEETKDLLKEFEEKIKKLRDG